MDKNIFMQKAIEFVNKELSNQKYKPYKVFKLLTSHVLSPVQELASEPILKIAFPVIP